MNRRKFIKQAAMAVPALSLMNVVSSCSVSPKQKPNIVLILADDLGYGDLSCYGQKFFETPNLDRMAQEGIKFTQHYTGSTVCAPSRCVLMTGKHTGHAHVRGNKQANPSGQLALPENETTIAKVLQSNGYKTGCFGKWGLGNAGTSGDPQKQGFDTFYGYYDQVLAHNSYPEFLYKDGKKVMLGNKVQYLSKDHWSKGLGSYSTKKQEYSNDLILDEVLNFIERNQNDPFFLYFPTTIPHDNGEALKGKRFEVPDASAFADKDWSDEEKTYAALVQKLDEHVGIVDNKLKELNLDQNTMILFVSDNGAIHPADFKNRFKSNGAFRGYKRDLYEGGIRTPLIAKWPGRINPGRVSHHISGFQDVFPTLCDLVQIKTPENLDGLSFLPTLLNKKQATHEGLYWEFFFWEGPLRACRMGKWKAIQKGPDFKVELYNLVLDPGEENDVADENSAQVQKMITFMDNSRIPSEYWKWIDEA